MMVAEAGWEQGVEGVVVAVAVAGVAAYADDGH